VVTIDPQNPSALSDGRKAGLEALKAKTDTEIDTSDIPSHTPKSLPTISL